MGPCATLTVQPAGYSNERCPSGKVNFFSAGAGAAGAGAAEGAALLGAAAVARPVADAVADAEAGAEAGADADADVVPLADGAPVPPHPASAKAAMAPTIPTPSLRTPARMAPTDAMFPTIFPLVMLVCGPGCGA
ncbi:hypothetical protein GCM10027090_14560 [Sinomonas soli]